MPLPQIALVVVFNVVIFDPELDLIREVQSFTSLPDAWRVFTTFETLKCRMSSISAWRFTGTMRQVKFRKFCC